MVINLDKLVGFYELVFIICIECMEVIFGNLVNVNMFGYKVWDIDFNKVM